MEIEHVELQLTEPTAPVKEKRRRKRRKITAVATVVPCETCATCAICSTRQVTFEDEEITARRKTHYDRATGLVPSASGNAAPIQTTLHTSAGTSVPVSSITSDVIAVSAQYDEYDEQAEDEGMEE